MEECWGHGVLHLVLQVHLLRYSKIQMLTERVQKQCCHGPKLKPVVSCWWSLSLSLSWVHMSWILLLIATKEENINKKSIKNYRFGQCQQFVLTLIDIMLLFFCFIWLLNSHHCLSLLNPDSFIPPNFLFHSRLVGHCHSSPAFVLKYEQWKWYFIIIIL